MQLTVPIEPLYILFSLQNAGYEAYLVGGAVRDLLRDVTTTPHAKVTDYDFTTNAKPEEILHIFPESFYENKFGTVSITVKETQAQLGIPPEQSYFYSASESEDSKKLNLNESTKIHESLKASFSESTVPPKLTPPFEITTFRSDGTYQDHRRPDSVSWGDSLHSDLDRRDFTINAMAIAVQMDVLERLFNADLEYLPQTVELSVDKYQLIDPHHGLQDLEAELIQTVGDPHQRFEEDALRMLRAIRFSAQLNMKIADQTFGAISQHSGLLEHVSQERIRDEFLKMIVSEYPKSAIEMLDETGLLRYVLPELLTTKGVEQGGHHTTDVWTHSLDAVTECPSNDPIVKLATLLHDIAKPETYQVQGDTITFYNHEVLGARTARQIGERLKLSRSEIDRLFILVRYHMFYYQPNHSDAAIRRFMRKVGKENLNDILDLREGDRLGSGARKTSWRLEEMKERMIQQLNQPFSVTDLAIDGTDVMQELHIEPGPEIGKILQTLFEEVIEKPELNTKPELLSRAKHIYSASRS